MTHYLKLEKIFSRLHHLEHLLAFAGWDRAVMMPEGGADARAAAMAEVGLLNMETLQSKELADTLAAAEAEVSQLDEWRRANLLEMKRAWRNATAVDADLVHAKTLAGAKCEQAWRKLRAQNDWAALEPLLTEVVRLTREEARQRAAASGLDPYDALMDLYEPGLRRQRLDPLFTRLKAFIPEFVQKVVDKQKSESILKSQGPFPTDRQRTLGLEAMKAVGFDFQHGRLDVSHHPFCGGAPRDVRITTRYQEDDFSTSFMGVLHETGHARYEQGLPPEWTTQPVGAARGMGMHESQSLFFEMQVSRSREFLQFVSPMMKRHLGGPHVPDAYWDPDNLYRIYTRVEPGYIRVDADEATYPAHVILRYEIEQGLIDGSVPVADLPRVWDEKMKSMLGLSTLGNDKNGCMQDIHWMDGAIGYFPTYTLGAMNAAQIFAAIERKLPDARDRIRKGEFEGVSQWLQENIWSRGCLMSIDELMTKATGEPLNPDHFIRHLETRYLA